jgi:acetylornithine deacetylase
VVFGPGDPNQAHKPDEHIAVDDLVRCARVYLLVALRSLSHP